jgi:hypothetical protein
MNKIKFFQILFYIWMFFYMNTRAKIIISQMHMLNDKFSSDKLYHINLNAYDNHSETFFIGYRGWILKNVGHLDWLSALHWLAT